MAESLPGKLKFARFKERNEEHRADYWKRCRALYEGGPKLLEDRDALTKVMPRHNRELDDVYNERLSRAFYIPYSGSIIDKITSELTGKPLTIVTTRADEGEQVGKAEQEPVDEYYADFFDDVSKPGGKKQSINQLARDLVLSGLQCGRFWTLVDLPAAVDNEGQPITYANRKEQDDAGARRAYAMAVEPECVIDWEYDESGALEWAITHEVINKRKGLDTDRNSVTLRYRFYTPEQWAVYEITYDKKKRPNGPTDEDDVLLTSQGNHSFGRVPLIEGELPPGLWAMAKLEAMARAHLNQRNALSWGQLKALFPMPVLYAGPPDPQNPITEDDTRGQQRFGPGNLWVLAEKDRMEYFSPDVATYEASAADLAVIRDEMHRVLHHMALSVDNSGAALQRSADSKAIDQAAASVILKALGTIIREHIQEICKAVATGRGEPDYVFVVHGMENFDDVTLTSLVTDAVALETVQIPSATFQKRWKIKIAKLALGADADDDTMEEIADELEESITQETFTMAGAAEQAQAHVAVAEADVAKTDAERAKKGEPHPDEIFKADQAVKLAKAKAKPTKKK